MICRRRPYGPIAFGSIFSKRVLDEELKGVESYG
jgi:hypothetical protein